PFHFTMSDTAGAGGRLLFIGGFGAGSPPLAATTVAGTTVVWFWLSSALTYTLLPSGETASERGWLIASGISVGAAVRSVRLKTRRRSSPEMHTNAWLLANTTSVGSSPTSSVRTTRRVGMSTMLTESEMWLITHTRLLSRWRTVTGSSPTI